MTTAREKRLVVKHNSLIDACFNLSLVEQRLMLLAITIGREAQDLSSDTPIEIKAATYREQYEIDQSETYKQLIEASRQIFSRQFTYLDSYSGNSAITVSRWVNEITYVEDKGMVVLYLNRNVIDMVSRLEEQFTRYKLMQVSRFKSKYSVRLYELVVKWAKVGKTHQYTVEDLRGKLGIDENEYKSVAYLKRDVLDKAVKEINQKSDLLINYEQHKQGRTVTHFHFDLQFKSIEENKEKIIRLTPKQIEMFSDKLSRSSKFQSHFLADTGASTEQYKEQIAAKLEDDFYVKEWLPYLQEVGFKS